MKKSIFCVSIIALAIAGCKKEQREETPQPQHYIKSEASADMLKFANAEDFFKAYNATVSYNNTERAAWEDAKNFVSFGRACDEFYFSINESIFEDDEKVEDFVKANSDKLQLIEDGNGEFSLETVLFKQDFRYFANKDKMFQIGGIVYLILEDGIASADYTQIDKLKEINENNYFIFINDDDVSLSASLTNTNRDLKDGIHNCGVWQEQRVTNNRERTYLRIAVITFNSSGTNQYVHYLVRPYKKTLGIWYWCTRHISCDIKVAFDYPEFTSYYSYVWKRKIGTAQRSNVYSSSLSGELCSTWISTGFTAPFSGHFGGYNCWADTPSTNPNVVLQANTFLCP